MHQLRVLEHWVWYDGGELGQIEIGEELDDGPHHMTLQTFECQEMSMVEGSFTNPNHSHWNPRLDQSDAKLRQTVGFGVLRTGLA
jgi:hypothetical protein